MARLQDLYYFVFVFRKSSCSGTPHHPHIK